MNINEVINVNDRFLKAPDLKGRRIAVRIESYTVEEFKDFSGLSKRQIVLKFHGAQKVFGLNKINTKMIASMYGEEADNWIGREVLLFPSKTQNAQGQIVDCVRIEYQVPSQPSRQPAQQQQQQSWAAPQQQHDERNPPPPATSMRDDMNDDIPF